MTVRDVPVNKIARHAISTVVNNTISIAALYLTEYFERQLMMENK
jgi:hypothetical protein